MVDNLRLRRQSVANRGDNQFDVDACIDNSAGKHLLTVSEVVYIDILSLNLDDKVWLTDLIIQWIC